MAKDKKNFAKNSLDSAQQDALDKVTGGSKLSNDATPSIDGSPSATSASKIKDEIVPKNAINTSETAKLVSGGAVPSVGVSGSLLRAAGRINYSGGADNVNGDHSAMANSTAPVKSGDRPGRQLDTALSHLDDTPAETYIVPISTIPSIKDGSSIIGYNGSYRNEHAVSQKASGGSPADSDFFRTLDECQFDIGYYANGQENGDDASRNNILSSWNETTRQWDNINVSTGSYLPREMVAEFDENQNLTDLYFVTEDITNDQHQEHVLRVAGDATIRNNNIAELDRLAIIDKSGDETKDNWSPIGKVIPNARTTNRVIAEVDKHIGDLMFLSGSKLQTAIAFQLNKAAKDGVRKVGPIFEMLDSNLEGNPYRIHDAGLDDDVDVQQTFANLFAHRQGGQMVYNPNMALGSSAMYIAIQDSTAKYNTKSKFLSLPLAFKTAVSTFKANCGDFRMHDVVYNEFNRQEVFGKVDNDGSNISPYFISDGASLIMNMDILGDVVLTSYTTAEPITRIHYMDQRNPYNYPVYNYLIAGLRDYINRHGSRICNQIEPHEDVYTWRVPITSTTTSISMWDVLLCAAAKDIAIRRRYAMDIICQYEAMNGYPYSHSLKLSEVTIGGTTNVGFSDIATPLQSRVIPLTSAIRILLPELFWVKAYGRDDNLDGVGGQTQHYGTVGNVVLPWYFSQNQFAPYHEDDMNYTWALNCDEMSSMTFFDYRGGNTFANADRVMAMDPNQLKLCLDRMVIPPAMGKQISTLHLETLYPTVYKYSYHEDGIPEFNYYIASTSAGDEDHRLTIRDILKTPRELGLSVILPAGVSTPSYSYDADHRTEIATYKDLDSSFFVKSGPSFRYRIWGSTCLANVGNELYDQYRDGNYAVNLMARYNYIYAVPGQAQLDFGLRLNSSEGPELVSPQAYVLSTGNYNFNQAAYGDVEIATNNYTEEQAALINHGTFDNVGVYSMLKYLYTRVNIVPFIINPFEINTIIFDGTEDTERGHFIACNNYDIYDFLHLFNMCGFRCGEYSGAEFDRNKQRIELGIGYVDDPYISTRS